jgi:hypothetical protein
MKHVLFTALAGAFLAITSAHGAEAASCRNLGYGAQATGSSSGASASACISTDASGDYLDANVVSTHTKQYSTVLAAQRACSEFKSKSSERQVRNAYDAAMAKLRTQVVIGTDTSDPVKQDRFFSMLWTLDNRVRNVEPTYTCNRSGRTNNFRVEVTYSR